MSRFRNAFGRYVPPREWEWVAFSLAAFALGSVPLAWLLHGFANVSEPWNVLPVSAFLMGVGLRLRRKRQTNSRPFLRERDDD